MLATFAQFERRLIPQRTKEALAGNARAGFGLGGLPASRSGSSAGFSASARGFAARDRRQPDRDGVPTAQGGAQWYAATVRGILACTA